MQQPDSVGDMIHYLHARDWPEFVFKRGRHRVFSSKEAGDGTTLPLSVSKPLIVIQYISPLLITLSSSCAERVSSHHHGH